MNKKKAWLIIFCLLLPFFLLLFSYKTTLFLLGGTLTPEQKETVNFLQGGGELELNSGYLPYTSAELSHLNDVKKVMQGADYFFYGLLLILTLTLTYHRKDKEQLKKFFKYGGITTAIAVLLVLIFILTNFGVIFTFFHWILFPQGNWVFAGDSLLIRTFPREFFVRMSGIIFVGTLILGAAFALFPKFLKKFYKEEWLFHRKS